MNFHRFDFSEREVAAHAEFQALIKEQLGSFMLQYSERYFILSVTQLKME